MVILYIDLKSTRLVKNNVELLCWDEQEFIDDRNLLETIISYAASINAIVEVEKP